MNPNLISRQMPFGLRMPPELRRRLTGSAKANNRSLNSEILFHLEQALFQPMPLEAAPSKSITPKPKTISQP